MKILNGEVYVDQAVASILNQSFQDFEFIIVDDGSTDGTWEALGKFAEKDNRIILLKNPENLGLPRSANLSLEQVRGQYIAIQDADDWSYPQRLEKQVQYMDAHVECVAVGSQMLVVNHNGTPLRLYKVPLNYSEIDHLHMNGFGGMLAHPAMVARTSVVREIGGYGEEFPLSDDYDLLLRLAEKGRLENLPDILVRYTQHSSNITGSKEALWRSYKKSALDNAWERRGMGTPHFNQLPNPSIRRNEGSRFVSLMSYGLKNILTDPRSLDGWPVIRGAISRLRKKSGGKL